MRKSFLVLFLVLLSSACLSGARTYNLPSNISENAEFHILTCSPGKEVYSLFGHTAIRLHDPASRTDIVFNYGTFDFNTDRFYFKFAKGILPYQLSISSYYGFLMAYKEEGRSIYSQRLNLDYGAKAELYAFWAKTMIAEVDDFNVPDEKKDLIRMRQRKIKDASLAMINPKVITDFKKEAASFITYDLSFSNMTNSEKIHHILMTFGINTQVKEITGFSSDTYLLEVSAGVKIGNIYKYRKDIANALNVPSVRIPESLAIYEGKSYLAVEAGKKRTETLLWDEQFLQGRKLPVGMDNFRNVIYWDLDNHSTPHLLVCGSTGSGKSVELRCLIEYARLAGVGDITVFDPKGEFSDLACGWIKVYDDTEDMYRVMGEMVADMQNRKNTKDRHLTMLVIDEFADIMDSTPADKGGMTMEQLLKMLAQKGRSLGFRIIAATQRASTKIITGDTKVNFPVQICFRMPKAVDSQVVIDEEGAESLQGQGDGLIKSPEYMDRVVRFQGFYKKS